MDSNSLRVESWQELEELTRRIFEAHGYDCDFRKVFKNARRKYEVDIVATKSGQVLVVDCKHYLRLKSRGSALRREAKIHFTRCCEYTKIYEEKAVPLLITFLDDAVFFANGCIVVPLQALNDFLLNSETYIDAFTCVSKTSLGRISPPLYPCFLCF